MIINHKYKFIFIKTRKTAGTSIEIALSQFCDKNDIITPIFEEDEKTRQELGFLSPQNYNVALQHYTKLDWLNLIIKAKRKQFRNHSSAKFIRSCIPAEIWNSYFKFTFERDPFDKAISRYYWSTQEPRPAINEYLNSAQPYLLSNWNIYTINDQIEVDFIGRYENLDEDLAKIKEKLGLPAELKLPRTKSNYRKSKEHYSRILNQEDQDRIKIVCAKEITALDYHLIENQIHEES